jgi:hypothetical protein
LALLIKIQRKSSQALDGTIGAHRLHLSGSGLRENIVESAMSDCLFGAQLTILDSARIEVNQRPCECEAGRIERRIIVDMNHFHDRDVPAPALKEGPGARLCAFRMATGTSLAQAPFTHHEHRICHFQVISSSALHFL